MLLSDDKNILEQITYSSVNRPIKWVDQKSGIFRTFPQGLKNKMEAESLVFHYHKYGVNLDSYLTNPKFKEEMKVLQTDTYCDKEKDKKNVTYIVAMEGKKYPIFAMLYHPELQSIDYLNGNHWNTLNTKVTDEIAYRISRELNLVARRNSNAIKDPHQILMQMSFNNSYKDVYHMLAGIDIMAFGFPNWKKQFELNQ